MCIFASGSHDAKASSSSARASGQASTRNATDGQLRVGQSSQWVSSNVKADEGTATKSVKGLHAESEVQYFQCQQ